jgi:hypothetical protein
MLSSSAKCWSEWQDLNLRPPRPERGALPACDPGSILSLNFAERKHGRTGAGTRPSSGRLDRSVARTTFSTEPKSQLSPTPVLALARGESRCRGLVLQSSRLVTGFAAGANFSLKCSTASSSTTGEIFPFYRRNAICTSNTRETSRAEAHVQAAALKSTNALNGPARHNSNRFLAAPYVG